MKPSSLLALVFVASSSCQPATAPPTREHLVVSGTAYERGLAHGTALRSKIRSFYTTLMTNSLFPFLSREQPDIATLLKEYEGEKYQNGRFAFELLLESAKNLERNLGRTGRDELRGIAEGSGLSYDEALILNTFVDTTLAVRGIGLAIRQGRAPVVESVELLGLGADGVDNDGDGQTDEANEGLLSPYDPPFFAAAVEVDVRTRLRVVFSDPDGVDPQTVRVRVNEGLFTFGDPALEVLELSPTRVQATWTPLEPLPPASQVTFVLSAGDKRIIEVPGPPRASFRRDEELVVTTRGAGKGVRDISRPALFDNRTRPPPFTVAVRNGRAEGGPLMAHSFALLDANTAHKHTVSILHQPDTGPAFVTVGWAGIVYGMSGLNERGVGVACNPSDTLDNSVVGSVLDQVADLSKARLVASGLPAGYLVRRVLERASTAAEGAEALGEIDPVYGWNCTVADDQGGLEVVELDSDVFKQGQGGVYRYGPTDRDPTTMRRYSSLTDDDVVVGSSYTRNVDDSIVLNLAGQRVVPQRFWSGFFFRSRRVMDNVTRRLAARVEPVDVEWLKGVLVEPEVVDRSDSMNAVVLDLRGRVVHSAMGTVPATNSPFVATEVRR